MWYIPIPDVTFIDKRNATLLGREDVASILVPLLIVKSAISETPSQEAVTDNYAHNTIAKGHVPSVFSGAHEQTTWQNASVSLPITDKNANPITKISIGSANSKANANSQANANIKANRNSIANADSLTYASSLANANSKACTSSLANANSRAVTSTQGKPKNRLRQHQSKTKAVRL